MEAQIELNQIKQGMEVFDAKSKRIGLVKFVYPGNDIPEGITPDYETLKSELMFALGGTIRFALPVLNHLYEYGFVRIGRGFFTPDAFIFPRQIDTVDGNTVYLNLRMDDILKG